MITQRRRREPLLRDRTGSDISHGSCSNVLVVAMRRHIGEDALNIDWHGRIISDRSHRCLLNKGRGDRYILQVTGGGHPLHIHVVHLLHVRRRGKV